MVVLGEDGAERVIASKLIPRPSQSSSPLDAHSLSIDLPFPEHQYYNIVSDWRSSGNTFTLTVTVPVNTSAVVYLPYSTDVRESGNPPPAKSTDGGYPVGSGTYVFTATAP